MKLLTFENCKILATLLLLFVVNIIAHAQTVTKTSNPSTTTQVDGSGNYGTVVPNSLTFSQSDFSAGCSITDVNVVIRWAKTDGTCTVPGSSNSFHAETSFRLDGPDGTQVVLIQPNTYTGTATMSLITTTFDQSAGTLAGGVTPTGGTFRPNNGNLNSFNGTNGIGTWTLRAGDTGGGDPLCIDWWRVIITTTVDAIAPTASCTSVTKVLNGGGTASVSTGEINNGSSDQCGGTLGYSVSPTSFTCADVGTNAVTLTVTDRYGNSSACTGFVIVQDNQAPTITCPSDITTNTNPGSCFASGVSLGTPTTSDNCNVTVTNDSPPTFPTGTTTVTWTVSDPGGNTTQCTQTVTVNDNENPSISCPGTVTDFTDPGSCTALGVALGTPIVNDNCTVTSVTNDAPTFYPLGSTTVTWTTTDGAGNTAQCTQTVIVTDNVNPTITCAGTQTVSTDAGSCEATGFTLNVPTTADNCSVASISNDAPATLSLGNTTVTWIVTDATGNTAQCTQTVIVEDDVKPIITCAGTQTISACDATGFTLNPPTTADNCSGVASVTNDAPAVLPTGTSTITWVVTDAANNTSTCTQTVIVADDAAPVISCPNNITVPTALNACNATGIVLGNPVVSDNCGVASVTNNAPTIYSLGDTEVTWEVTDDNGNVSSCIQTISVLDFQAPFITCPGPVTATLDAGSCEATGVNIGLAIAVDNCTIAGITNNAPAAYLSGITEVTWTVTDDSGNTASCAQTVEVVGTCTGCTDPLGLTASVSNTNVSCFGSADGSLTLNVVGGTPPYSFNWDNGAGTVQNPTGLDVGWYNVTITDANGCTVVKMGDITQPSLLSAWSWDDFPASCAGAADGQASIAVSGGTPAYTYLWDNGENTATAVNLTAGLHSATVTDSNGCTATASVTISSISAITASAWPEQNVTCDGLSNGVATASGTGGTLPYTYEWDNGENTATAVALSAGTHIVTVTDVNGCFATASATINSNASLTATALGESLSCFGDTDGNITLTVGGGTPPYAFSWSNGIGNVQNPSNLGAGWYSVTVTDANGCTATAGADILEPALLSVTALGESLSCFGDTDGNITLTVGGGTPPYAFNWSNGIGNVQNPSNLGAGWYSVTVTDANGCTATSGADILEPALLDVSVLVTVNAATAQVTGGTPAYAYNWSNGATTSTVNGLVAGNYQLTVTDANGCTSTANFTINGTLYDISGTVRNCNGEPLNQVNLQLSGASTGTAITPIAGTYTFTDLPEDNFTVTPSKTNTTASDGLSVLDIARIRRHILGIEPFTNECELIAADVTENCSITVFDINMIRAVILGIRTDFPSGKVWRFVPADYDFPIGNFPCTFPESIDYTPLSQDEINQDFIGIKLGDVNSSANPNFKQGEHK